MARRVLEFGLPYDLNSIARLESERQIKSVLNRSDIWHFVDELHQFVKQNGSTSNADVQQHWGFLTRMDCRSLLERINLFRFMRTEIFCNSISHTENEIVSVNQRTSDISVPKGWNSPTHDIYLMDLVNRFGFVSESYIFAHSIFEEFKRENGGAPNLKWVEHRIQWLLHQIIEGRRLQRSAPPPVYNTGRSVNSVNQRAHHPPTYSISYIDDR